MNRKLSFLAVVCFALFTTAALAFEPVVFEDPAGDDNGHGAVTYPNAPEYKKGSFDLRKVEIKEKGDKVQFKITFKARIEDPWGSKNWTPPGQGFSLQFVHIYIDTDHKAGSGHKDGLPGMNIRFKEESRWEKVVLVSPQPTSRVKMEVKMKAKALKADVVVPARVSVKGKSLSVAVPKSALGDLQEGWGWQVVVQSNEGYPDGNDVLTRDVNEIAGDHRFGGGSDWDCDPHAIDILAGKAKGEAGEAKAQHEALKYECAGSDLGKAKLAELPMIYK